MTSTAKNSLKQQLQLKVRELNAVKDLFEQQSNRNEGLSIPNETLLFLRSQKVQSDRSCSELMKLQLKSEVLKTLATESAKIKLTMRKRKKRAKDGTSASDTESAVNISSNFTYSIEKTVPFTQKRNETSVWKPQQSGNLQRCLVRLRRP